MGLPEVLIEFKTKADTAVRRSQNGIVAVILADDTKSGTEYQSAVYSTSADYGVSSQWSTTNRRYLNLIFKGNPKKVLVERIKTTDDYTDALARLKNKQWNWLCVPGIKAADVETIGEWIISQRDAKKTFKTVLPCSVSGYAANNEGIVDFATEDIRSGAYSFSTAEYCARIAGLLAGLSMDESATYQVIDDISGIKESTTPDDDIDSGKFIIINDGEKFKVGMGINSLHILSDDKTEDMKKIKIIEGMDLIRDDIRTTFEENYIGTLNSYDNKLLFVSAVNAYFRNLASEGILYSEYDNIAEIDADAAGTWLTKHSYDISDMSDDEIKRAKTGSYVFVKADVQFADAIENLQFEISMN